MCDYILKINLKKSSKLWYYVWTTNSMLIKIDFYWYWSGLFIISVQNNQKTSNDLLKLKILMYGLHNYS